MKIKIRETSITNFHHIYQLDITRKRFFTNNLNPYSTISDIIKAFQYHSQLKPKIKKVGIHVKILFKIQLILEEKDYQQIIYNYIEGIGWNDLQSIGFISLRPNYIEIDLIFNRVTHDAKLIDLRCLGAKYQQYELLENLYLKNFFQYYKKRLNFSARIAKISTSASRLSLLSIQN